jgi:hypothetical protein
MSLGQASTMPSCAGVAPSQLSVLKSEQGSVARKTAMMTVELTAKTTPDVDSLIVAFTSVVV